MEIMVVISAFILFTEALVYMAAGAGETYYVTLVRFAFSFLCSDTDHT